MDENVSSISQMGLQWNSISSPASKYMNGFAVRHQLQQRPFFFTFMKSYCNHGYGLSTQTHGYGSTT